MKDISFDDGEDAPRSRWQYPREYIDMLREMADTVGIIGQRVNLKQSGTERWMGVCPFHNDHNPSFSVSQRGYKCFGCDAKGDVIKFLMTYEGMTFGETIKHLQQLTGLIPPNKRDALDGLWAIREAVVTADDDPRMVEDEDTIERMLWEISHQCRKPLLYKTVDEETGEISYGWEIPIVYERVMLIFRMADDAMEKGDVGTLKDIIRRIRGGQLNWNRIANEQGRENSRTAQLA